MSTRQKRRVETEQALVRAVGELILSDGMDALGVNAIARVASVDKVLIYRYFDGLPGLLRAFGESADFWPSIEEVADEPIALYMTHRDPALLARHILERYLRGIRARPICRKILAWEPAGRNALTIELETTRQRWNQRLIERFAQAQVPYTREALVLSSIFSAAFNYLTAREQLKMFGDLDLSSDEGWRELFDVVEKTMRALGSPSA